MQTEPIRWKRGEFITFYAQMKIRVGGINGNLPVDILAGDEFEYDGSIVKYAGAEFPQPGLRGAIAQQWATLDPDGEVPAAFTSNRSVAKSQTVNKDLSRVQRRQAAPVEMDHLDEETVLEVGDRDAVRDDRTGRGHLTQNHNRRKASTYTGHKAELQNPLEISQSDFDQQDHTPIARVKSKANLGKIDVTTSKGAGLARDLAMASHEDGYGAYSGQRRRSNVIEREGVTIKTSVGNMDRNADIHIGDEDEGEVVGRVRHTDRGRRTQEGVDIEDTSGRPGRQAAPKAKAKAKAAPKPKAKAPAKPKPAKASNGHASPKLKIAKRVCKEFPDDWNFYGKTEDKLAALKELGESEDMILALYAAESSTMKKALEKRYPKVVA